MLMMKKLLVLPVIILICFAVIQVFPCTIFNAAKNGRVLAGNNEDMFSTDTKVWFIPGEEGKYGVVYVGIENNGKQGAMNDQGLFFDGNALKYARMKPQKDKLSFPKDRDLIMMIMEECATVEDVVELMSKYNLEGFNNAQGHFADKTGGAAVIGPDKNGDLFVVRKKGIFQVWPLLSLVGTAIPARGTTSPQKCSKAWKTYPLSISVPFYLPFTVRVLLLLCIPTSVI